MLIFELLDQYEGICRRAFFGCATKLNKTFKANIIEILILIMCIPRKINFLQLGRYGRRKEQRYRQTFRKDFGWLCFNMNSAGGADIRRRHHSGAGGADESEAPQGVQDRYSGRRGHARGLFQAPGLRHDQGGDQGEQG